ncbi:hypothetical protein EXS70_01025, partial [Candidatus Peribacteria bacterium]|nr:hypothetical protein [Candidatus Peribacteria bacterium]
MFTPSHRRLYRMEREAREVLNNMHFQAPNPDAYNASLQMQSKAQAQYINRLETAFMTAQAPNYRT